MSQAIEGVRWTIHDIEVLPENEWTRYEIINGELARLTIVINKYVVKLLVSLIFGQSLVVWVCQLYLQS
ncbi:hypothetical protein [Nostoc spongiaeforme]|uniref:hypothetical protein n=1 Tax=Nostoc spongiaeforme TaxID=502487 RepID=UPI001F5536DB|nr:hypothetical protein [Nostoc spongiaeforme]